MSFFNWRVITPGKGLLITKFGEIQNEKQVTDTESVKFMSKLTDSEKYIYVSIPTESGGIYPVLPFTNVSQVKTHLVSESIPAEPSIDTYTVNITAGSKGLLTRQGKAIANLRPGLHMITQAEKIITAKSGKQPYLYEFKDITTSQNIQLHGNALVEFAVEDINKLLSSIEIKTNSKQFIDIDKNVQEFVCNLVQKLSNYYTVFNFNFSGAEDGSAQDAQFKSQQDNINRTILAEEKASWSEYGLTLYGHSIISFRYDAQVTNAMEESCKAAVRSNVAKKDGETKLVTAKANANALVTEFSLLQQGGLGKITTENLIANKAIIASLPTGTTLNIVDSKLGFFSQQTGAGARSEVSKVESSLAP